MMIVLHLGHIILRQAGENSLLSGCRQKWGILSSVHCPLHTVHFALTTVHCPLCTPTTVHCPVSTLHCSHRPPCCVSSAGEGIMCTVCECEWTVYEHNVHSEQCTNIMCTMCEGDLSQPTDFAFLCSPTPPPADADAGESNHANHGGCVSFFTLHCWAENSSNWGATADWETFLLMIPNYSTEAWIYIGSGKYRNEEKKPTQ